VRRGGNRSMSTQRMAAFRVPGAALAGWGVALALTIVAKPPAGKVDAQALYEQRCQACHLADGNSQVMPNMSFADGVWAHGSTLKEVVATITNGVPGTAMVAWKEQLSPAEITALAKFVRKFDKKLK
jgi:mono/diheme cytochrome c family protein